MQKKTLKYLCGICLITIKGYSFCTLDNYDLCATCISLMLTLLEGISFKKK